MKFNLSFGSKLSKSDCNCSKFMFDERKSFNIRLSSVVERFGIPLGLPPGFGFFFSAMVLIVFVKSLIDN